MPRYVHLRSSSDFRQVYAKGRRYHGFLMSVFVYPNGLQHHRFGITASRKAVGNAVERNRSKRLLRETFRQNVTELEGMRIKYDWVVNAKRSLLRSKLADSLKEFRMISAAVESEERRDQAKAK